MHTWIEFTEDRLVGRERATVAARSAHDTPEIGHLTALHSDLLDNMHVLLHHVGNTRPMPSPTLEVSFQVASILQGAPAVVSLALDGVFLRAAACVRQDLETYLRIAETARTGQANTDRFTFSKAIAATDARDPDETHRYLYEVLSGLAHGSDWNSLRHSVYRVEDERGEFPRPWPKGDTKACSSLLRQHVVLLFFVAQVFARCLVLHSSVPDSVLAACERQWLAVGDALERLSLIGESPQAP